MNSSDPSPALRVERAGDRLLIHLPPREARFRWGGAVMMVVAAFLLTSGVRSFLGDVTRLAEGGADADDWFILLVALLFVVLPVAILVSGVFLCFGRCRVEWNGHRLTVVYRAGPLFWSRRLPRQPARGFQIQRGVDDGEGGRRRTGTWANVGTLLALYEGRSSVVVRNHPIAVLEAVAGALSAELATSSGPALGVTFEKPTWATELFAAIRADWSLVVENRMFELQVVSTNGKTKGLLVGRDVADLRWLATQLRVVLAVPAAAQG